MCLENSGLRQLLEQRASISVEAVEARLGASEQQPAQAPKVVVDEIDLGLYDTLLETGEAGCEPLVSGEVSINDGTAQKEGLL